MVSCNLTPPSRSSTVPRRCSGLKVDIAVQNPEGDNTNYSYTRLQRVRILLVAGQTDKAMDGIEDLLNSPYQVTPSYLALDPMFTPLKGNPRFERLLASKITRGIN